MDRRASQPIGYVNRLSEPCLISPTEQPGLEMPVYASPPAPAVAAKPLEWQTFCSRSGNCEANTSIGQYVIQSEPDGWCLYLLNEQDANAAYSTLEYAKAAAQADYEQRIRSALVEPAPAVTVPEGMALVPIKPTNEMLQVGYANSKGSGNIGGVYAAMLAAAPQPPAARSYEEGIEHWKRQAEAAGKNAALFQQDCAGHVKEKQALRAALAPFSAYAKRELDKTIPRHIQDDDSSPVLTSGLEYEDVDAVIVTVGDLKRATAIRSLADEPRHE